MTKMLFRVSKLTFIQKQSIILDYNIRIRDLPEIDRTFLAGALGNYSLAGFEMVSTKGPDHLCLLWKIIAAMSPRASYYRKYCRFLAFYSNKLFHIKHSLQKILPLYYFMFTEFGAPCNVLHYNLLFALWIICGGILDILFNPSRYCTRYVVLIS